MPPILNAQLVTKQFGARPLFQNISLTVDEGARIGLIGPNGAGKSTLLAILAGQVEPDSGELAVRKRARAAYVPQDSRFAPGLTTRQVLERALSAAHVDESDSEGRQREGLMRELGGRAGFTDLTAEVATFVDDAGAKEGAVTLFIRHTSASLTIQENADPTVLLDLTSALDRLAPEGAGWQHDTEGPDDMPAHVRSMLTATSLQIPVLKCELALGTWQAIYLIEHRRRPHAREIVLQFTGSTA